ncbi:MAG: DNA polymerase I [Clostridia bacterium]|nr:DNA polymerase I [Clostridia bacterium]
MTYKGKRLLIIDGSSLAHRAFYALPLLTNRQGVYTNAAYGFLTMLLKILASEPIDYIGVAFDKGRVTFRTEQYAAYKGHRKATPPELAPQFAIIKDLLAALRIPSYELDNYEADDLIGTLAKKAEGLGFEVLILTGDRDALHLVSGRTKVLLTRKGISQIDSYDENAIQEKYGLTPAQLIDVKGLMGDSSDNIPGVPGVGEKTAVKLIKEFGDLEQVLANIEQINGPKLRENLDQYREQALLSKKLATIVCDAPLDFCFDECLYQKPDYPALLDLYKELEFNSLVPGVLAEMKETQQSPVAEEPGQEGSNVRELMTLQDFKDCCLELAEQTYLAVEWDIEGSHYLKGSLKAVGIAGKEQALGYELKPGEEGLVLDFLKEFLGGTGRQLILHDGKQLLAFCRYRNFPLFELAGDTMVAAYLLNPGAGQQTLEQIVLEHLNLPLVAGESPALAAAGKAAQIFRLHPVLLEKLKETEMLELYRQVELPLVGILAAMEARGVKLDLPQLEEMGSRLAQSIDQVTKDIYLLAGEEFNINSPKQLGRILFDKLGLPPVKKTKTGYSTNAEVLEELAPRHPIVANILHYRQLVKLQSTYIEGLRSLADPQTGKVHTTFNQTVTATGRLSSQEPNLQNIPIRLELGRLIRKAFIPSGKGRLILAADYSQIELRVLAHISGDANLIDAFIKGQDIHTRTASEVFGVAIEEVTPEMRRQAKAVNFGIVYGISDYGLSRDLGISRKEAGKYIDLYFSRYPGVKNYIDRVILEAKEKGYVATLLNRRRYLPDLFSSNRNIRAFGERTAMNTPIQGTAADIIKLAMIEVEKQLRAHDMETEMILQVHDELIFEVPEAELSLAAKIIGGAMENALPLQVPLVVEVKVGPNWYDMRVMERENQNA